MNSWRPVWKYCSYSSIYLEEHNQTLSVFSFLFSGSPLTEMSQVVSMSKIGWASDLVHLPHVELSLLAGQYPIALATLLLRTCAAKYTFNFCLPKCMWLVVSLLPGNYLYCMDKTFWCYRKIPSDKYFYTCLCGPSVVPLWSLHGLSGPLWSLFSPYLTGLVLHLTVK